jgi:Kef-type K+ transport system membrane component KefB
MNPTRSADSLVAYVLIGIVAIVLTARVMQHVAKKLRQPAVVGEIVAGIALGPTLLGVLPGHLTTRLFPLDVRPALNVVAQLGLVIFMFIVGLDLDTTLVRGKERIVTVVSMTSVALPFGLGILLAGYLYRSHKLVGSGSHAHTVRPVAFALFVGAALAVTAFPVMARILTERGMQRTNLGVTALAAAAVDDVLAWSLLAVVISVVVAHGPVGLVRTLVELLIFVAFLVLAVKPQLRRVVTRYQAAGRVTPDLMALLLVGLLLSAFATAEIGIHPIFGAFVFGAVMPREGSGQLLQDIVQKLEQVSVLLLLPVFFVLTGLNTNVRELGHDALTQLPLILLVACVGKFVGAAVAARVQGIPGRQACALGTLMNARGLTGLIILTIGVSLGVLDNSLFSMLVVVGVITTIMTEPVLRVFYPDRILARDIAEAEKATLGDPGAYRLVLSLPDGASDAERMVNLSADLVGDERPSELLMTRYIPVHLGPELGSGLTGQLGEMATSVEEMRVLAKRAEHRGLRTSTRSQFSADPAADLSCQAAAVDARVVLVPLAEGDDQVGLTTARERPFTTVLVVRPNRLVELPESKGTVIVVGSGDVDGIASLELALRLARSRQAILQVADDVATRPNKRLSRWARRLSACNVECRTVSLSDRPLGPTDLAVLPMSRLEKCPTPEGGQTSVVSAVDALLKDSRAPVLLVRAGAAEDGRDLDRLVERFALPRDFVMAAVPTEEGQMR